MPNLSIKDVPEAWAEALRQRAIRNHRSLQGELMAIVEAAIAPTVSSAIAPAVSQADAAGTATAPAQQPALPTLRGLGPVGRDPAPSGRNSVRQVMAELKAKYPEPVARAPLGRDIIRAERDAR